MVLAVLILITSCVSDDVKTEGDNSGPTIEILKPIADNNTFYTRDGIEDPNEMILEAIAVDDSTIERVDVNIYTYEGEQLVNHEEDTDDASTSYTQSTSFSTLIPGRYIVEFEFRDVLGNWGRREFEVICLYNTAEVREEVDNKGPGIAVVSPSENGEFYTDGGTDSPDFIVLNAEGTDDSSIAEGSLKVYNSSNMEVFTSNRLYEVEDPNARSLNETFRTATDGDYTVEFMFKDTEGNTSKVTRNIKCIYSELPGDTDS